MEILSVLIYNSDSELILLHETSPKSPINLQNINSFNLINLMNENIKKNNFHLKNEKFILFINPFSFSIIFCHNNSTILFCEKIKNIFLAVLQSGMGYYYRLRAAQRPYKKAVSRSFDTSKGRVAAPIRRPLRGLSLRICQAL